MWFIFCKGEGGGGRGRREGDLSELDKGSRRTSGRCSTINISRDVEIL
jgi:hypothetical protein